MRNFEDIIGHQRQLRYIKECLRLNNLPNIILLSGKAGIGKSSIAKILACELAYEDETASQMEFFKTQIIDKGESTNEVLLFNMSQMKDSEETKKVRASLNPSVGQKTKKVIILDEAHGMTPDQQDALLVGLEQLDPLVYVIICTTSVSYLREAFMSRCKVHFRLQDLTLEELTTLTERIMNEKGLSFQGSKMFFISTLTSFCKDEPRRLINTLNLFKDGQVITTDDLKVFFNVDEPLQVIKLLEYLYVNYVQGLEYVQAYPIEQNAFDMITRCALATLGVQDKLFNGRILNNLIMYVEEYGDEPILNFLKDISKYGRVTRENLIYAFLNNNVTFKKVIESPPETQYKNSNGKTMVELSELGESVKKVDNNLGDKGVKAKSLAQLINENS